MSALSEDLALQQKEMLLSGFLYDAQILRQN